MKKIFSTALITTLMIGLFANSISKTDAEQIEKGTISVNTTASSELYPDIAEVTIAIISEDNKSLQKATDDNKEISEKIYTELAALIDKEQGDYIKTSNFNASPIYTYKNDKKTFLKYEVSNNIIVKTKSLQNIGKIIDKSILLGAKNISNLNFSLSNYDAQCNDLLLKASKIAFKRASILANTANNTVAGIKYLNGSCSTNNNQTQYRMLAKSANYDSATGTNEISTSIQSGAIKLNANVTATYFVK